MDEATNIPTTTDHDCTCVKPPVRVESVESVECGHAGLAHEGLLLGVDPDVDLDTAWSLATV